MHGQRLTERQRLAGGGALGQRAPGVGQVGVLPGGARGQRQRHALQRDRVDRLTGCGRPGEPRGGNRTGVPRPDRLEQGVRRGVRGLHGVRRRIGVGLLGQSRDGGPLEETVEQLRAHPRRVDRLRPGGLVHLGLRVGDRRHRRRDRSLVVRFGRDLVGRAVDLHLHGVEGRPAEHRQVVPHAVEAEFVLVRVLGEDAEEQPGRSGRVEGDLQWPQAGVRTTRRARQTGIGVIGRARRPTSEDRSVDVDDATTALGAPHDVGVGEVPTGQVAASGIAHAVVHRQRIPGDHLVGEADPLDLDPEVLLLARHLVHEMHREGEVGPQRLQVARQVGGGLDEVDAGGQVLLDARVAELAAVVVGADHAPVERRQRQHGIAVLGLQVDPDAPVGRQGERVVVRGVARHDPRTARVQRPGTLGRQVRTRRERPEIHDLTACDTTDGQREVRRAAAASADGGGFQEVDARREVAFDAGGEARPAVVVVREAGAVAGEQVEVRISLRRGQLDPDAARAEHLEAEGVGVAAGTEARLAVLRRPAPIGLQDAVGCCTERPQTGGDAVRRLLGGYAPRTRQGHDPGEQGHHRAAHRHLARAAPATCRTSRHPSHVEPP